MTGQKFSRLTVIKRVENHKGRTAYLCKCDCGNEKIIIGKSLLNGRTVSCGCYNDEKRGFKHKIKINTYDLSGDYGIGYTSKGGEFYFDLGVYDKIKNYCWHKSVEGYIETHSNNYNIKFHRYIMNVTSDYEIDHIDGIRHNNRKYNLRKVKDNENEMNAKIRKDNTSNHKGVSYNKSKSRWTAYINYKNKRYNLGDYINKEDAILIREIAELKLFKEYSRRYKELKEKYKNYDL